MKPLPEAELNVMLALWQVGDEATRAELETKLAGKSWSANTVNTLLARLQEKGFVRAQRAGRSYVYTALVSAGEYRRSEGQNVLQRLYGSSVKNFVAALAGGDSLRMQDIEELETYLRQLKEETP